MATRGKPSVFSTFNQLRVSEDFDSDNDSAEERQQERKEKQKQKKKTRNKKKSSDSAQLKDLAFVSVSKPKKSKNKKNKATSNMQPQSPSGSPVEDAQPTEIASDEKQEDAEPKLSMADMIKQPQKIAAASNGAEKNSRPPVQQQQAAPAQQQKKKATSPPKKQTQPQQIAAPPVPSVATPTPASEPQSSSETELGAVYTPSHITITRVDGQMRRTVAVTEVMDQLLHYTQQNAQLLMVQDQLGHANRNLQDQLQRSAEIVNGLQNEVTMFRQMCLNLQAEVSLLRSSTTAPTGPDAGSNPQPQHHHRPPPGMS